MKYTLNSILIVDDDENALKLYEKFLSDEFSAKIVTSKHPSHAYKLATQHFYDICLLDITMEFHGSPFGGIDLYNLLSKRYGANSLIAYSQYITDDLLKRYQCSFNFVEKGTDLLDFIRELTQAIRKLREQQTCFVAMPFDKSYTALYNVIENAILESHYIPLRLDNQIFTSSIVDKIFIEIESSKVVIFVATDRNPNAFYECGYSVCLCKEVITITDFYKNLPFDIRDRNAIAYGKNIESLKGPLKNRLCKLTQIR